jgi:glyoxylase-like metal-dependent hydrolase (beta-lactamase superfamily II)
MNIKIFEFNYFPVNTYLLYDETGEAILVDCGCINDKEIAILDQFLTEHKLTLKRLICTHLHLDHVFGNAFIKDKYGIEPEAHAADISEIPPLEQQVKRFNIELEKPSITVTKTLKEGDVVRFGNSELQILHVPGHSPGSIALYSAADNIAIVGDVLFHGSIGRTDLWGGDQDLLIEGILTKLFTLPNQTKIYSGHGPKTSIQFEKKHNPYLS